MRTLSAAAQAAMDSGTFEAYIRVGLCDAQPDNFVEWIQPISFKLSDIEAEVTFPRASMTLGDGTMFALRRGVVINGTPEYTTTTTFYVYQSSIDARYITLKGHLFKPDYKTLGVNLTWQQVVEAVYLDELNPSYKIIKPTYENASHAVWGYQFYPTGRTVVFSSLKSIVSIFKQKFLVFMRHTENTFDASAVKTDIYFYQPTETRAVDYTITDLLFSYSELFEERRLLWRDDANSVHIYNPYAGAGFLPKLHNLGYIPTAGNRPTYKFHRISGRSSKLIPNLKYETGDYITVTTYTGNISFRAKVTEIFDPESSPAWYIIIEQLQWFANTEGGAMPSTIEAATPYTPLNTSYFNSLLSESDNNIQAAMDTIDDHTHTGLVTNGDSHDHNGGDGAAITEAAITLADNTTNNVTTSKHGFTPKAPNDTSKFLRGDATWAVPNGVISGFEGQGDNYVITPSVSSNNLTVALKTVAGTDASASDPIKIRIGNTLYTIAGAFNFTKNAGTNWCNAGGTEHATQDIDFFVYAIKESGAFGGFAFGISRIPNAKVMGDFVNTTTSEKYIAGNWVNFNATDPVEVIGRINLTLSATSAFNWSIPATSIVINHPIYFTRTLTYAPVISTTYLTSPSVTYARYSIHYNVVHFWLRYGGTANGSPTVTTATVPLEAALSANSPSAGASLYSDGGTSGSFGGCYIGAATPDVFGSLKYNGAAYSGSVVINENGSYLI